MNNITCSICQENECDMITECNHNFHRRCLNRWLERRQTCPVCRHILSSEDSEDDSEIGVDFTLDTEYDSDTEFIENTTIDMNNAINEEIRNFDTNMTNIINNFTRRYNNTRELNRIYETEIIEISNDNHVLRNENLLLRNEITSLRRQLRNSERRNRERNNIIILRRRIMCLEHSINAISNRNNSTLVNCLRQQLNIIQNDNNYSNNINNILNNRITILENLDTLQGNRINRLREITHICDNIIRLQKEEKDIYERNLLTSNNEIERLTTENTYYKNYYNLTRTHLNTIINLINNHA
jgi:hypothetical protein